MRSCEQSEIARQILAYLARHSEAQDTIEGIAEWWLLERKITQQTTKVERALDELVEKGMVEMSVGPDDRKRYRAKSN